MDVNVYCATHSLGFIRTWKSPVQSCDFSRATLSPKALSQPPSHPAHIPGLGPRTWLKCFGGETKSRGPARACTGLSPPLLRYRVGTAAAGGSPGQPAAGASPPARSGSALRAPSQAAAGRRTFVPLARSAFPWQTYTNYLPGPRSRRPAQPGHRWAGGAGQETRREREQAGGFRPAPSPEPSSKYRPAARFSRAFGGVGQSGAGRARRGRSRACH